MPEPEVSAAWRRIDAWLRRHAPGYRARLNPPASDAELRRAEQDTGATLPGDLVTWWRRANGVSPEPPSGARHPGHLLPERYDPYPVAKALDLAALYRRVARETAPSPMADQLDAFLARCGGEPAGTLYPHEAAAVWLPQWLPIAGDAGGGGLFIDLRPGPLHGCVVRHTRTGHADSPAWPSVTSLLTYVADALEAAPSPAPGAGLRIGGWALPCR
ncbi:SMI1/KNR4 family protein [Streptomyces sp. URMC 123]|uniref:SMI1/KNR4 family protein n=1 Tax=Streptomyces sp. URMC 123 TaxID=3423403 RepID=UPI003F1CD692